MGLKYETLVRIDYYQSVYRMVFMEHGNPYKTIDPTMICIAQDLARSVSEDTMARLRDLYLKDKSC